MTEPEPEEGWKFLWNAPKAHYFKGMSSACGRWMTWGTGGLSKNQPSENECCKACLRKVRKNEGNQERKDKASEVG